MNILVSLLPTLFKLVGWIINRGNVSKEQRESFLSFYAAYEKLGNASARQHDEVNDQLNDLK